MPDVLIVQSDAGIRNMLRATMELEGYACAEAEDGISAWNLLRRCERTYVVLLSDMLPDLRWHDLLLVVARDAHGAGRHAYVVTSVHAERHQSAMASVPAQLAVSLLPLPGAINALPNVVAQAARRLGIGSMPLPRPTHPARPASGHAPRRLTHLTLRVTAASAGPAVTVCAHTRPGAVLTIGVRYGSGRTARSPELRGPRCADDEGCCQWQWRARTASIGRATVSVAAEWNGQRVERTQRLALGASRRMPEGGHSQPPGAARGRTVRSSIA